MAEREKIVARLTALEAQDVEAVELAARLQQREQDVVTLSQEVTLLRVQLQEAKAKWSKVQNVVLANANCEAGSNERLNNFEAALNSKAKETAAAEEKRAQMEERYKKIMEQNPIQILTFRDVDLSLGTTRAGCSLSRG